MQQTVRVDLHDDMKCSLLKLQSIVQITHDSATARPMCCLKPIQKPDLVDNLMKFEFKKKKEIWCSRNSCHVFFSSGKILWWSVSKKQLLSTIFWLIQNICACSSTVSLNKCLLIPAWPPLDQPHFWVAFVRLSPMFWAWNIEHSECVLNDSVGLSVCFVMHVGESLNPSSRWGQITVIL